MKTIRDEKSKRGFYFVRTKKRLTLFLVAAIILSGIQLGTVEVQADDSPTWLQGILKTVDFTKNNATIENGDSVSIGDGAGLKVVYQFNDFVPTDLKDDADTPSTGLSMAYTISVPTQLKIPTTLFASDLTVYYDYPTNTKRAAVISRTDDKTLAVRFDIDNANTYESIQNFEFDFQVALDGTQVSDGDETTIDFSGHPGSQYTIRVTDPSMSDPSVTKEGTYDASTRQITWTINVLTSGKRVITPLIIKDSIGPNQSYVNGTLQFGPTGSLTTASDPALTTNADGSLSFSFDTGTVGNTTNYQLTYKTKIDDSYFFSTDDSTKKGELNTSDGSSVSNTASLYKDDGTTKLGSDASYSVTPSKAAWFAKTGTLTNAATGEMTWTLTVNTNGYSFESMKIYDQIPKNTADTSLSMDYAPNSLIIKGNNGGTDTIVATGAGVDTVRKVSTIEGGSGDKAYNWSCDLKKSGETNYNTYTITYKTVWHSTTDWQAYLKSNKPAPQNAAWLSVEWKDGVGPDTYHLELPTVVKADSYSSNVIEKRGTYNKADHTITWTVTINTNSVNIGHEVYVEEYLSGLNGVDQRVQDQELTTAVDAALNVTTAGYSAVHQSGDGTITGGALKYQIYPTVNINADVTTPVEFTFITKILDETVENPAEDLKSYFAGNNTGTRTFYNSAKVTAGDVSDTVSASVIPTSKVLEKASGNYDQSTKKMTWTVTVNDNEMPMNNVTITDTIVKGLNISEVQIDGVPATPGIGYTYTGNSDYSGGTMTIPFGNITAKKTITYVAEVNTDEPTFGFGLQNNAAQTAVTINNHVKLSRDSYGDVEVDASKDVPNEEIAKTSSYPAGSNDYSRIQYAVNINKNQVTIPNNTVVTDTISDGLQFDMISVKLYFATVAVGGTLTKGSEVVPKAVKGVGNTDGTSTLFVTLPDNSQKTAYILEYKAIISDPTKTTFTNTVRTGSISSAPNASYSWQQSQLFSRGGSINGIRGAQAYAQIIKQNRSGVGLVGATYTIYAASDTTFSSPILSGVSDTTGTITFGGLTKNTNYKIKETAAPTGYQISSTVYSVRTSGNGMANMVTALSNPDSGTNIVMDDAIPVTSVTPAPTPDNPSNPGTPSKNVPLAPMVPTVMPVSYSPEALAAWTSAQASVSAKRLPKTGGFVGSAILFMIGAGMTGGGIYLSRSGKKCSKRRRDE
ncbi:MAG: collagen binding domain-containing protein [bacterium]|nr:collagen binding domain-containing protein [bacterium]